MTRRAFLGVTAGAALAGLGGAGLAHHALQVEPWHLAVSDVALPAPLSGPVRLAFISDLHLGPYVSLDWIAHTLEVVNGLSPDLVLLGGDYVTGTAATMPSLAEALSLLNPPHGVYAVLGNHDWWTDREMVTRWLAQAGVRVLANAGQVIQTAGGAFYLAGLEDVWEGRPDLAQAMADHREGLPTILMQHEPDPAIERADDARLLLQLAGHTHGGQVNLPLIGTPVLPPYGRRYAAGLYAVGQSQLYVTRGIGMTSPPVRLNCPPEVALITLQPETEG